MQDLALIDVPPSSAAQLATTSRYTDWALTQPQVDIPTTHLIHAGMYHRTCMLPKNTAISGALIKIDTVITFSGSAYVYTGDGFTHMRGYMVLAAAAGRAQIFIADEDTHITMSFATTHTDVSECEKQFTDSWAMLGTNRKATSCQDG